MRLREEVSFDDYDEIISPRPEESDFDRIVGKAISRRGFLLTAVTLGASAFLMSTTGLTKPAHGKTDPFGFKAVKTNRLDSVTLPEGYRWESLIHWGDPLWSTAPPFDPQSRGTAASQALAFGDNNDGMAIFLHDDRHILVVNNEYTNRAILYGNRPNGQPETADDYKKSMVAHGLSLFEISKVEGIWKVVKDSEYNRRITAETPMMITGPAAGHELLKTESDPKGKNSLGTWNNCGCGVTPWGTFLTCEENFNGYFSSTDPSVEIDEAFFRYGSVTIDTGLSNSYGVACVR